MEQLEGGFIYEVNDQDYILGSTFDLSEEITKRMNPDNIFEQYNQLSIPNGQNACTIFATCGAISDLTGYKFTKEELQSLWNSAVEQGASLTEGWFFYKAVDHVRKWWNLNKTNKLVSFRLNYNDASFLKALDNKHSLIGGFRGNSDYNVDSLDGTLVGTNFDPSTYGHCIRLRKDDKIFVVDNYFGKKTHNTYTLEDMEGLIKEGTFFKDFYLFLPTEIMNQDQIDIQEAQKLGLFNGERKDDPVTRQESVLLCMRLKRLLEK